MKNSQSILEHEGESEANEPGIDDGLDAGLQMDNSDVAAIVHVSRADVQ